MLVPQPEACRPTRACGAYLRVMAIMQWPTPAMLFSCAAQSVGLAVCTGAGRALGEGLACSA